MRVNKGITTHMRVHKYAQLTFLRIYRQVAARLTSSFSTFRRFDETRQGLMRAQLERLLATEGLSKDAFEVASRSIKG